MIVGDCRVSVAETIKTSFHVLVWNLKKKKKWTRVLKLQQFADGQAADNRFDIAVRVVEYAKQLGTEVPDYTNEVIQQS